jgi:Leucine-rich repeat (LRR) protein
MQELEQQKEAIIKLFESWLPENAMIAIEILKGNPELKELVTTHYLAMTEALFGTNSLDVFIDFTDKLAELIKNHKEIPYFKCLESAFTLIPISYVNLNFAKLNEFPWWILLMPQLTEVDLRNNKIEEIPEEISNLYNLENLILNHNKLKRLPQNIGKLKKLTKLQLDYNNIEELPESIGDLESLNWLCLEANKIEFLPKTAVKLKSLSWLSIEKTPLGQKNNIYYGIYTSVGKQEFINLLQ